MLLTGYRELNELHHSQRGLVIFVGLFRKSAAVEGVFILVCTDLLRTCNFHETQIELHVSQKLFYRIFYECEEKVKFPLSSVEHHTFMLVGEWDVAVIIGVLSMRCS